ncbi:MAG: ABC transporter permease [Theionarchaea archaeon]|nr:ABC transporter permease [Theionarchaea archaeon]
MSLLGFVTKRIVAFVVLVFIVITGVFIIFRAMPFDSESTVISQGMPPDMRTELREQFGLDKSMGEQYIIYLKNVLHGDLGVSFYFLCNVSDIIRARLFPTALLTGTAVIIALIIDSLAEGLFAKKSVMINTLFYLIPFLFLGLLLIYWFSYRLDLVPVGGMKTPELWQAQNVSMGAKLFDVASHLFLPLLIMVIWVVIGFIPLVKTTSRGVIEEKKALIPAGVTTLLAASIILVGARITENTFSWPGLNSALVEASLNYDYPLAQGTMIAGAVFALVLAVVMETFYAVIASLKSRTSSL